MPDFDYSTAFSRNIGWITKYEASQLKSKRVAIAGMGGVGGIHMLTLTRLGIGAFSISDFDVFELANFNRQAGAMTSTIGRPKAEVLHDMAKDINPELDIRVFPDGVSEENIHDFLEDVDIYIDGLDFFVLDARRLVYDQCAKKGIPIVVAAPFGMGVALINYIPGKMPLNQYFGLNDGTHEEQVLRFLIGLSPAMLQRPYLVDQDAVDLANFRGPSTPMACEHCAGAAATEALKILLGRGKVTAAPRGYQFDAYRNKKVSTWRPWGSKNPIQQLGLMIARKQLEAMKRRSMASRVEEKELGTLVEKILDSARWAPSGDNNQTWNFELVDENSFVIHGRHIGDECVYDIQGHASEIALGALLETVSIAASEYGMRAEFEARPDTPEDKPTFDVTLHPDPEVFKDPLALFIRDRSVQRRALGTRMLTNREKQELEASVGEGYRILWLDGFDKKLQTALLLFRNAGIRLTMPEAYREHKKVIQWGSKFSEDRIPDQALGTDPILTKIMKWAMGSWERVNFLNRYAAGTWLARIEMDLIPGLACGAHYVIVADSPAESSGDYISAGKALQRFWLTATKAGLQMQPELTPLIFRSYVKQNIQFTKEQKVLDRAEKLMSSLDELIGATTADDAVYMGRVGAGAPAKARSLRRPLDSLIVSTKNT